MDLEGGIRQDDATYRLMWQGSILSSYLENPLLLESFFPIFSTLSFHEDSAAWGQIYKYLIGKNPTKFKEYRYRYRRYWVLSIIAITIAI